MLICVFSQITLCALGVWAAWRLRRFRSAVLLSLGVTWAGIAGQMICLLLAGGFQRAVLMAWIKLIPEAQRPVDLYYGTEHAALIAIGLAVGCSTLLFSVAYVLNLRNGGGD